MGENYNTSDVIHDVDISLLKLLDKGIEDVAEGKTFSHTDAMKEVERLREQRRQLRESEKLLQTI